MKTLKNLGCALVLGGVVGLVHVGWGALLATAVVLGEARKLRDRLGSRAR